MPVVDSLHPGLARSSKRTAVSYTGLTSVAATGVITLAAGGFLDRLQNNDVVSFSGLTGGTGLTPGADYFIVGMAGYPASGATTFQVATTPGGAPITAGTNITAGTITSGKHTQGDYGPSPNSARGRAGT